MANQEQRVVEIYIPSDLGYEKVAIASVATVAKKMDFSGDRIEDLKTAVSEACINAIEHGNAFDVSVKILVVLTADWDKIKVNVIDGGAQPIPANLPDELAPRNDHRGMGMFLIKALMDEVEVKSQPGRNEIQMIIYLER